MNEIRDIKRWLKGAPAPKAAEIEELENCFEQYVFYKKNKKTTSIITTCCHRDTEIDNMPRLMTPFLRQFLFFRKHNQHTVCPLCGKTVTAKAMGRVSNNLYEGFQFTFLTEKKCTLYSIHGYARRRGLEKNIMAYVDQVIRYEPGHVKILEESYFSMDHPFTWELTKYNFNKLPTKTKEEFVFGENAVKKTPFKYIPFDWATPSICRALTLAAFYPAQMEMLLKLGWDDIVEDMLYFRCKNQAIFNWDAKEPRKAWKISKELLKEYQEMMPAYSRRPWILRNYIKIHKKYSEITLEDSAKYAAFLEMVSKLRGNIDCYEALKYFKRQRKKYPGLQSYIYKDYIENAYECDRDLTVYNVCFPKDLYTAHDEVVKEANLMRKRKDAEKEAKLLMKMWEDIDRRSRKFNFSYGGYFIRVALSADEVRNEGRTLCHCVGGYAERHIASKLTILFLRKLDDPNTPLYTVEVSNDGTIIQAHGYMNERTGAKSPMTAIPWFFEAWEYWYQHGSKRDKDGNPKIKSNITKRRNAA